MEVKITDDFDLKKIVDSGQCFRPCEKVFGDDKFFRFITAENVLYIRQTSEDSYEISCSADDWTRIWIPYFDLETNYEDIRRIITRKTSSQFITDAVEFGRGIRILRQDHLEMLISYIISQQKNIPSIRKTVEKISEKYGTQIETQFETIFLFPTLDQLSATSADDLKSMSLGYRVPYILDAVKKLTSEIETENEIEKIFPIDLENLETYPDSKLLETLRRINGVGEKVSNCVALYSYHRMNCVPIDTWMKKALTQDLDKMDLKKVFGDYAGIAQQYIFYFKRGDKNG